MVLHKNENGQHGFLPTREFMYTTLMDNTELKLCQRLGGGFEGTLHICLLYHSAMHSTLAAEKRKQMQAIRLAAREIQQACDAVV